jgi:hypothetical protein
MVSLFHHTSPWTHRCLQASPSAHRNGRVFRRLVHRNGRVFRRLVHTACCYYSQMNASRLWWSVCWCEYSKTLGKAVQIWRIGASRFEWQNTKDRFQKLVQHWQKCIEVCGNFVEKWLCIFENNWCRHISFFISLKYFFPFIFYLTFRCRIFF